MIQHACFGDELNPSSLPHFAAAATVLPWDGAKMGAFGQGVQWRDLSVQLHNVDPAKAGHRPPTP
jgi:hypothetical protein